MPLFTAFAKSTVQQDETLAMLKEIAPNECESAEMVFMAGIESNGYIYFEFYSDNVYRSGEIRPDGSVSWN